MKKPSSSMLRCLCCAGMLVRCCLISQASDADANQVPNPAKPWTNSLGMKFAPVPGTAVLFSIWDTRVQDFSVFVNDQTNNGGYDYRKGTVPHIWIPDGGWGQRGWEYGWYNPGFAQTPDHPVVCTCWEDAKAFCAWLTVKEQREGKLTGLQSYRLPTDAEWSYAVGLGELEGVGTPKDKNGKVKDIYPWGTQWPPPKGAGNYIPELRVDDYDWGTSPVGSFAANRYGLYDMGGNVWQWCEDLYNPYQKNKRPRKNHVLRGYSHGGDAASANLLSSVRCDFAPDYRDNYQGFRVVLADGGVSTPQAAFVAATTPVTPPVTTKPNSPEPPVTPTDPNQPLLETLSHQAPNAMAWALAPLDVSIPGEIRQNLTILREDLLDEGKAKPKAGAEAYAAAWQLCDALIVSLDERDRTLVRAGFRAAQADANTRVTNQSLDAHAPYRSSWPQYARIKDQRAEIFRQQMNNASLKKELPKVEWSDRTTVLRKGLDGLYAKYRDALRQSK